MIVAVMAGLVESIVLVLVVLLWQDQFLLKIPILLVLRKEYLL